MNPPERASTARNLNEETLEEIAATMDQSQGALKKLCLKRDNFRCIATGLIDVSAETEQGIKCFTELAHILPFSIGQWENSKDVCQSFYSFLSITYKVQDHRVSQIWATLTKLRLQKSLLPTPYHLFRYALSGTGKESFRVRKSWTKL
jgi:hypothetical protein